LIFSISKIKSNISINDDVVEFLDYCLY